ncbi:CPBP family intramembrane glutamic endopeptidase [Listeria grayi]|uniref:CPBP family intramembrane glutamic endopeptidase n=1 Tax=Listeria grayi TaxID=1641 RepID=UPI001628D9EA|nr:CPBP family intramembrane glutamic endopeptidase [Listeria grayi]MBC1921736.1 CPBP family intramembrane metalloprotease [Listeria grayi]
MIKLRTFLRKYPLLTAFLALTVAFIILLTVPAGDTVLEKLRQEIPLTLLTMLLLVAIGGTTLIKFKRQGIGFTFRKSILYLLPGILGCVFTIVAAISSNRAVHPDWLIMLLQAVIFYLLLGLFEEGLFRGVILQAFLVKMGKTRQGLIAAVAIGGFIFGFAHILLSWFQTGLDLSGLGLLQALLKTISAGMAGFFFGAIYLKTRNIWGIALVHGASDLLLMVGSLIFSGTNSVSYISSDPSQAMSSLIVNTAFIVIYIPLVVSAWRQLKTIPLPETGFYREEWK